jgi:titin
VTQIAIKPCASRNSAGGGSSQLDVFYRFNGANSADAGAYAVPTGTTPADLATTTFSGLSLLQGTSSTLEIGAVYTSGTKGLRLSRIASTVTYTVAPSSLSASATTTSSILLSWTDASDNETAFSIERSLDGSSWSVIASTSANATSYINSGLSAGTTYYYRVRGAAGAAFNGYTNTANATTVALTPPNAPSALSATAATSSVSITLAWTDNSSDETAFEILRSTDGISFAHLASTTANTVSYSDAGLATGTTYYYQVRAYGVAGYSSMSNVASATSITVPTAPSSLNATASTSAIAIALSWTDNSADETAFEVLRSTDNVTFTHLASTTANATTYNNMGLPSGTTYYYQVRAYSIAGYSSVSNTASATTGSIPSAPSGLSLSKNTGTTTTDIILTWVDNASNESGYAIERKIDLGTFKGFATTSADVTTYTDLGLTGTSTYSYRIRAFNGFGYSAYSNTASTTLP